MKHSGGRQHGFSLVELLMAIFILGIGIISVAALFPAGIAQQRRSVDDVLGPVVANNAMTILRSKLRQDDFGTLQEFLGTNPFGPQYDCMIDGDWPWIRPGIILGDDPATQAINGEVLDDRGSLDIFGWHELNGGSVLTHNEFAGQQLAFGLAGLPYSTTKYDPLNPVPLISITRGERAFPSYSLDPPTADLPEPQFYWDCAFRRFQGRIYVAVFVYRVTFPPGVKARYTAAIHDLSGASPVPMVPFNLSLVTDNQEGRPWMGEPWDAVENPTASQSRPFRRVPGTAAGQDYDPTNPRESWQTPRQWMLDQNNNIHRVLAGRRSGADGPVELAGAISPVPLTDLNSTCGPLIFDPFAANIPPNAFGFEGLAVENIVFNLWYVPSIVRVDTDGDGSNDTEVTLTPVYVAVEML